MSLKRKRLLAAGGVAGLALMLSACAGDASAAAAPEYEAVVVVEDEEPDSDSEAEEYQEAAAEFIPGPIPVPEGAVELADGSFLAPTDFEDTVFDEETGTAFIPNELIIDAVIGTDPAQIRYLIAHEGATIVAFDALMDIYRVRFNEAKTFEQLQQVLATWRNSPLIEYIEMNEVIAVGSNSSITSFQTASRVNQQHTWGLDAISVPAAWALLDEYRAGWDNWQNEFGITVGLIDNSIQAIPGYSNVYHCFDRNRGFVVGDCAGRQLGGVQLGSPLASHGIHVAGTMNGTGTLRGQRFGVAPGIRTVGAATSAGLNPNWALNLRFWESYPTTRWSSVERVRLLAVEGEARAINISMAWQIGSNAQGQPCAISAAGCSIDVRRKDRSNNLSAQISRNIERLHNSGVQVNGQPLDVLFVVGAGNDNAIAGDGLWLDDTILGDRMIVVGAVVEAAAGFEYLPSATIGATGWNRGATASVASHSLWEYSNHGHRLNVVAPGGNILSTIIEGPNGGIDSGTSYAAPHVTGTAALIWAANPYLSASEVRNIITNQVTWNLRPSPGYSDQVFPGLINAEAAVRTALELNPNVQLAQLQHNEPEPDTAIRQPGFNETVSFMGVDFVFTDLIHFGRRSADDFEGVFMDATSVSGSTGPIRAAFLASDGTRCEFNRVRNDSRHRDGSALSFEPGQSYEAAAWWHHLGCFRSAGSDFVPYYLLLENETGTEQVRITVSNVAAIPHR